MGAFQGTGICLVQNHRLVKPISFFCQRYEGSINALHHLWPISASRSNPQFPSIASLYPTSSPPLSSIASKRLPSPPPEQEAPASCAPARHGRNRCSPPRHPALCIFPISAWNPWSSEPGRCLLPASIIFLVPDYLVRMIDRLTRIRILRDSFPWTRLIGLKGQGALLRGPRHAPRDASLGSGVREKNFTLCSASYT